MRKLYNIIYIQVIVFLLSSCIEYSPYDAEVQHENVNSHNIPQIIKHEQHDTIQFIVISDTHDDYNELWAGILYINSLKNIDFVAVVGDITNSGLTKEFEWYYDNIEALDVPFITAIGNHDYRSNGAIIYRKMFGPTNFYFQIEHYRFIVFDDVVWENNNATPDFNWLRAVANPEGDTDVVLLAHIPYWGDQLSGEKGMEMKNIIDSSKIMLCAHGHEHTYVYQAIDSLKYLVNESIAERALSLVTLYDTSISIQEIKF